MQSHVPASGTGTNRSRNQPKRKASETRDKRAGKGRDEKDREIKGSAIHVLAPNQGEQRLNGISISWEAAMSLLTKHIGSLAGANGVYMAGGSAVAANVLAVRTKSQGTHALAVLEGGIESVNETIGSVRVADRLRHAKFLNVLSVLRRQNKPRRHVARRARTRFRALKDLTEMARAQASRPVRRGLSPRRRSIHRRLGSA